MTNAPQSHHYAGRGPFAEPRGCVPLLRRRRFRQADRRRGQRPQHDESLQCRHPAAGRARDSSAEGGRRDAPGLRLSNRDRRNRHGHGGDEVFARIARSDCRRHRSRGQRTVHGRSRMRRRLRQEHAGQHDGDGAHQRTRHLRLCRHYQAGLLEGREAHDREPVRSRGRVHRRQDEQRGFRGYREERCPDRRRLRRSVHREYDVPRRSKRSA